MNLAIRTLTPLTLAMAMALSACGGGGGGAAGEQVSGVVEAPDGQVAIFKQNQSVLVAAIERFFPGAYAAITGLEPVTGATVELIRVDNDGNQVGAVLASTVTSITGDYNLALPSGVDFSGDLILRITGNGGSTMSAMVVEQEVDINPISQFILDKFIEDGTELAELPVNEVVALTGRVDEFDLTAAPGSNLAAMLDQLEAEVGQFVDTEIAVINSVDGDGSSVAGNWKLVAMSMDFHDSDGKDVGTFAVDVNTENLSLADGGSGTVDITAGAYNDVWTNFQTTGTSVSIYKETDVGSDDDTFPGNIDADGNLSVPYPFEEELQSVDTQVDLDGPDYGWRWPPGNFYVENTGSGKVLLSVNQDAGVRYETTDTDNDGVKDAVDPGARDGDEVSIEMAFLLRKGSGMSESSVSGNYGMLSYQVEMDSASPRGKVISTRGLVTFNGVDTLDIASNANNAIEVWREPATPPAVTLTPYDADDANPQSLSYTVSSTGTLDVDSGGVVGQVSSDGKFIASVGSEDLTIDDKGNSDPSDDEITETSSNIRLFTKLGTGMTGADFANTTYALRPLILGGETSGHQFLFTLSSASNMAFDGTGANVTITASDRGVERDNDVAEVEAIPVEAATPFGLPVSVSSNGAFLIEELDPTGEDISIEGYMSADRTMFVARLYINDNTDGGQDLGLVVGIKQ